MKIKSSLLALAASAMAFVSGSQAQTAIFGSGNQDGFPSSTTSADGKLQVSLRGKTYNGGVLPNAGNVYTTPTGVSPSNSSRANWNIEFNVNTNLNGSGSTLAASGYNFTLYVDTDASVGTNFHTIDLKAIPDNAYGLNTTGNGAGTPGTFIAEGSSFNIMQNSENMLFAAFGLGTFDPNANGTYSFRLDVTDGNGALVLSQSADIQVGTGGGPAFVPVPEPSTYAMFGVVALMGAVGVKRFRNKKQQEVTIAA